MVFGADGVRAKHPLEQSYYAYSRANHGQHILSDLLRTPVRCDIDLPSSCRPSTRTDQGPVLLDEIVASRLVPVAIPTPRFIGAMDSASLARYECPPTAVFDCENCEEVVGWEATIMKMSLKSDSPITTEDKRCVSTDGNARPESDIRRINDESVQVLLCSALRSPRDCTVLEIAAPA